MFKKIQVKLVQAIALGLLLLSGFPAKAGTGRVTLQYDDGTMESKRSISGGGHAVLFTTPDSGPWYLTRVALFGARYGYDRAPDEDFSIYITDPSMETFCKIAKPYGLFKKGREKWNLISIPAVKVPQRFYVCFVFNPTQTKGVYVGVDENVVQSHSKNAVPENHIQDLRQKGDWMIRAEVSRTPKGKILELQSKPEREMDQQAVIAAQESRLLKGAQSRILAYDDGKMNKFQSYGGSGAQIVRFEAPPEGAFVYGISFYGSQYGAKHDSEAVNGDVYILDKDLRVITRTSFPYSLLTYQKAWVEVPTLLTKVTGSFYVAIHAHSEQYKGLYVGYDTDIAASHSSIGTVGQKQFTLKPLKNKQEWMIRVKLVDKPVYYE